MRRWIALNFSTEIHFDHFLNFIARFAFRHTFIFLFSLNKLLEDIWSQID